MRLATRKVALLIVIGAIGLCGLSARADDTSNENSADPTANGSSQSQGKSCLSLCLQDGEDLLACADYCTMVAMHTAPEKRTELKVSLALPICHY